MQFKSIEGHGNIVSALIGSVRENRIPHGLLFVSPEGAGAIPMALAYANYIACENRSDDDSCGRCNACLKFSKLVHPDLHFSFPVQKNEGDSKTPLLSKFFVAKWRELLLSNPWFGQDDWVDALGLEKKIPQISADEVHEVVKTLQFKPFESEYKFLIMWLPERMNATGANRLLKTLEEPPEKTVIILVTENQEALLTTILSRTQQIRFSPLSVDEAAKTLQKVSGRDADSCKTAVLITDRNIARARRLLEHSEDALEQLNLFRSWMQACYAMNIQELLRITELFAKESREWQKGFFEYALYMVRQSMLGNHSPELAHQTAAEAEFIEKFRKFFHPGNYSTITGYINEASGHVERNVHGKIMFFDLSLLISEVFRKEKAARAEAV